MGVRECGTPSHPLNELRASSSVMPSASVTSSLSGFFGFFGLGSASSSSSSLSDSYTLLFAGRPPVRRASHVPSHLLVAGPHWTRGGCR